MNYTEKTTIHREYISEDNKIRLVEQFNHIINKNTYLVLINNKLKDVIVGLEEAKQFAEQF